jgi:hypothetical protein
MMSALSNPARILWMLPHPDQVGEFFGPFWYRNNGSQYLNLLIPVTFGMLVSSASRAVTFREWLGGLGKSSDFLLIPMLVVLMAGTFTTKSRGGAIFAVAMGLFCWAVLLFSGSRRWLKGVVSMVLLVGIGGAGALGWEVLRDRFLFGFNHFDAALPRGLDEWTLRWRITVPTKLLKSTWMVWVHEGSTESKEVVRAVRVLLDGQGRLETRLVGRAGEQHVTLALTNALLMQAGRSVDLALVRSNSEVRIYLEGEEIPFSRRIVKEGRAWSKQSASVDLHLGRIMGPHDDGRIHSVTLLGYAVSPQQVTTHHAKADGSGFADDQWAQSDPPPLVHVSPQPLSPAAWTATGYNGRDRYYQDARQMDVEYPPLFGSGPGTFGNLYRVYLHPHEKGNYFWYVHDDHLEMRLTWGWGGSALIYGLLIFCMLPIASRAGVPVPRVLSLCMTAALAGALLHASKDWIFEMHALLFLGVMWCAVLSSRTVRRGNS